MAEILVRAVDNTNARSARDDAMCYKRGDVVCVKPDDHLWSEQERSERFVVLRVPGEPEDYAHLTEIDSEIDFVTGKSEKVRRRGVAVDLDALPSILPRHRADELAQTGFVQMNLAEYLSVERIKVR